MRAFGLVAVLAVAVTSARHIPPHLGNTHAVTKTELLAMEQDIRSLSDIPVPMLVNLFGMFDKHHSAAKNAHHHNHRELEEAHKGGAVVQNTEYEQWALETLFHQLTKPSSSSSTDKEDHYELMMKATEKTGDVNKILKTLPPLQAIGEALDQWKELAHRADAKSKTVTLEKMHAKALSSANTQTADVVTPVTSNDHLKSMSPEILRNAMLEKLGVTSDSHFKFQLHAALTEIANDEGMITPCSFVTSVIKERDIPNLNDATDKPVELELALDFNKFLGVSEANAAANPCRGLYRADTGVALENTFSLKETPKLDRFYTAGPKITYQQMKKILKAADYGAMIDWNKDNLEMSSTIKDFQRKAADFLFNQISVAALTDELAKTNKLAKAQADTDKITQADLVAYANKLPFGTPLVLPGVTTSIVVDPKDVAKQLFGDVGPGVVTSPSTDPEISRDEFCKRVLGLSSPIHGVSIQDLKAGFNKIEAKFPTNSDESKRKGVAAFVESLFRFNKESNLDYPAFVEPLLQ